MLPFPFILSYISGLYTHQGGGIREKCNNRFS
jgi:hypothetical protein